MRPVLRAVLAGCLALAALGAAAAELTGTLSLTQTGAARWVAEYRFDEPVARLRLEPTGTDFRHASWRVLTPGVKLEREGDADVLAAERKLDTLRIEIDAYDAYDHAHYVPMDRYGDGGADLYLGYFDAEAADGPAPRALVLRELKLTALPGRRALAPARGAGLPSMYAYFGPAQPQPAGRMDMIVDPRTPDWIRARLAAVSERVSGYFEEALGRALPFRPLMLIAAPDLERNGVSVKGGALGNQVVYRLEGKRLTEDSAATRNVLTYMIAHEMAHIFQANVRRGGIGPDHPWIHEGGAEALALEALRATGLLSAAEADQFAAKLRQECAALHGDVSSRRGAYACGFVRFSAGGRSASAQWRRLQAATEASGRSYDPAMFEQASRPD